MKKILFVLTMVLMSVCSFGQEYKTIDIPLSVEYGLVPKQEVIKSFDTIEKSYQVKELVTSKISNRGFKTDSDGSILTILTLEDGHIVTLSVANNLTIAGDIIGSDYSYYITRTKCYPYYKEKYDTIYVKVNAPKYVNLALLKVKSEMYIDNKTHYSAKIYSYSLDKAFWIETDNYFYKKHENDKRITKRKARLNKYYMEYSDYKMFLNFVYTAFRIKNYNFIETPSN